MYGYAIEWKNILAHEKLTANNDIHDYLYFFCVFVLFYFVLFHFVLFHLILFPFVQMSQ